VQQSATVLCKFTAAQQPHVQIFSTELHQDQTSNTENTGRNMFTVLSEVWLAELILMKLTFAPQRFVKSPDAKCYSTLTNGLALISLRDGEMQSLHQAFLIPHIEHQKSVFLV